MGDVRKLCELPNREKNKDCTAESLKERSAQRWWCTIVLQTWVSVSAKTNRSTPGPGQDGPRTLGLTTGKLKKDFD